MVRQGDWVKEDCGDDEGTEKGEAEDLTDIGILISRGSGL